MTFIRNWLIFNHIIVDFLEFLQTAHYNFRLSSIDVPRLIYMNHGREVEVVLGNRDVTSRLQQLADYVIQIGILIDWNILIL